MGKKTEEREAQFSEQSQAFAEVCAQAHQEGCECPVIERDGRIMKLVGKQLVKGIGEVPCERRCQWDSERIDRLPKLLPARLPDRVLPQSLIQQPAQLLLEQP